MSFHLEAHTRCHHYVALCLHFIISVMAECIPECILYIQEKNNFLKCYLHNFISHMSGELQHIPIRQFCLCVCFGKNGVVKHCQLCTFHKRAQEMCACANILKVFVHVALKWQIARIIAYYLDSYVHLKYYLHCANIPKITERRVKNVALTFYMSHRNIFMA